MERVIVTVKDCGGRFERDMELPADLPVSMLAAKLLAALKRLDDRTFSPVMTPSMSCGGERLDGEKTLDELEIWDGSIITVP